MLSNKLYRIFALVLAVTILLTACSTPTAAPTQAAPKATEAAPTQAAADTAAPAAATEAPKATEAAPAGNATGNADAVLTLAEQSMPTFTRNFNPFITGSPLPGTLNVIHEPLMVLNGDKQIRMVIGSTFRDVSVANTPSLDATVAAARATTDLAQYAVNFPSLQYATPALDRLAQEIAPVLRAPRLNVFPTADGYRLAWNVITFSRNPFGLFVTQIDAQTGEILRREDLVRYQDALPNTADIFPSTPTLANPDTGAYQLTDGVPTGLTRVNLRNLNPGTNVTGVDSLFSGQHALVGNILAVSGPEVAKTALLYGVIGLFHFIFRKKFLLISVNPKQAEAQGISIRLWDFLFYASFGFVVTSSVAIAGVLLVFCYLIVPSVGAMLFADRIGGANYGKSTAIYKFEKIKRAKRKALADHPDRHLLDFGIGVAGATLAAVHGDEAARDLAADLDKDLVLMPGSRVLVPTGIAIELPEGLEAQIRPRSGLALKYGVTLVNSPGTIDADYRGEVGVIVINHGVDPFIIRNRERIAQMVFAPFIRAVFEEVVELGETDRGAGGFGHTGR